MFLILIVENNFTATVLSCGDTVVTTGVVWQCLFLVTTVCGDANVRRCRCASMKKYHSVTVHLCGNAIVRQCHYVAMPLCDSASMWQYHCAKFSLCGKATV